jgi:hypothetical protein
MRIIVKARAGEIIKKDEAIPRSISTQDI